jgi:hypothetical protein
VTLKLSKSRFVAGLQCSKRLWLSFHKREEATPPDAATQAIFDQGHVVGVLAQGLYPGGVTITEDHLHLTEAVRSTEEAVKSGAKVLYEAGAEHGNVRARADIMAKNADGTWDMIEVKSSTDVHDEYIYDLGIQRWIFEGSGYRIRKTVLCHLDTGYVRQGELDIRQLFTQEDVTERVEEVFPGLAAMVVEQLDIVALKDEPKILPGRRCEEPNTCEFIDYCWKALPQGSVYELAGWKSIAEDLFSRGSVLMKDIPADVKLNGAQKDQVEVLRTGEPIWKNKEIRKYLEDIEYPLYFLDFEAFMQAVPPFDRTSPYEHIPFQYSIHRIDEPGREPVHLEYLASGTGDPRMELCGRLLEDLGDGGTVFSYSPYEVRMMNGLGAMFPDKAGRLQKAVYRVVDLAGPFRSRFVVHPGFGGSYSIKKVLPALVPGMGYGDMEVGQGMEAVAAYRRLGDPALPAAERESLRKALLVYCAQDTLAMVKLFEILKEVGHET